MMRYSHGSIPKSREKVQWWKRFFTPKNTKPLRNQEHQRNSIKSRRKPWMESAACLRYGIKARPCMESSQSGVWNQSEGGYTLARDAIPSHCDGFHTPCGWFHANPSDWIEKRPFENGLFSCLIKTERLLPKKPYFTRVLGIFAVVNSVLPCSFSNHWPPCIFSRFFVIIKLFADIQRNHLPFEH